MYPVQLLFNICCTVPFQQNSQQSSSVDEGTTTTVQFIAVSATEHARMVSAGELPESVHGADVHMQIPGADAQRVSFFLIV